MKPTKKDVWRDNFRKTTDEAKSLADADLESARKKTERLRKLRLAKEAGEGVTELDKKPARKNVKPRRRA
jgi:hypothetical protein